jgi:hypothetical protein
MRAGLVLVTALALSGCATSSTKSLQFVEHPYCTVEADQVRYRFHSDPNAALALAAAAARWRSIDIQLESDNRGVEKDCLDSVVEALRRAGKNASFTARD